MSLPVFWHNINAIDYGGFPVRRDYFLYLVCHNWINSVSLITSVTALQFCFRPVKIEPSFNILSILLNSVMTWTVFLFIDRNMDINKISAEEEISIWKTSKHLLWWKVSKNNSAIHLMMKQRKLLISLILVNHREKRFQIGYGLFTIFFVKSRLLFFF